jgi:hypothetical protein
MTTDMDKLIEELKAIKDTPAGGLPAISRNCAIDECIALIRKHQALIRVREAIEMSWAHYMNERTSRAALSIRDALAELDKLIKG